MGIALGLGIVFGVRAVEDSRAAVLPVIVLFVAAAIITRTGARQLSLIAAAGCLIGAAAGFHGTSHRPPQLAAEPVGVIEGQILSDPSVTFAGIQARFAWRDDTMVDRESTVYLPATPVVSRGDRIEIHGRVDGEAGDRIFADDIRVLARAGWLEQQRRSIRHYLTDVVQQYVPGTPGALTLGLLIGDDSALTEAERDDLRRAGLSHLTAVSGWNVTLVTGAVGMLCLQLGLRGWGWTALQLIALAGFVWIVGLDPPVTRAALMAVAGLVAIRLGRPAHSVTVLTLTAATMVAVSPEALTSLSFQLSVLATLGLVLAARIADPLDGWRAIVLTPLIATAIAGLITAPLLASEFGTLSLLTIPANLLAGPLVPAATVLGIVVVATSPMTPLAMIAGWAAWLLSAMSLWIARVIGSVPYGYYEFAPLSDTTQAAIYAVLLITTIAILPEGRLFTRTAAAWMQREPIGAALSASAAGVALLAATIPV